MTKIKIGECSVDSGQIMILDPCYVLHEGKCGHATGNDPCSELPDANWTAHSTSPAYSELLDVYQKLSNICFVDGPYDDGGYPVYAEQDNDGNTTSITIELKQSDEDDED